MTLIVSIAVIIAMAAINRFRGGGIIPVSWFDPPGHRRFWATALVAGVAALWFGFNQEVYFSMEIVGMSGGIVIRQPLVAVAFSACWLIWAIPPWGRWYTLGWGYRWWSGPPDAFESAIEAVTSKITRFDPRLQYEPRRSLRRTLDDHLCLALRNVLACLPLALIFGPMSALIVIIGMNISYELAWGSIHEEDGPTAHGELGTGAFWGLALIIAGL